MTTTTTATRPSTGETTAPSRPTRTRRTTTEMAWATPATRAKTSRTRRTSTRTKTAVGTRVIRTTTTTACWTGRTTVRNTGMTISGTATGTASGTNATSASSSTASGSSPRARRSGRRCRRARADCPSFCRSAAGQGRCLRAFGRASSWTCPGLRRPCPRRRGPRGGPFGATHGRRHTDVLPRGVRGRDAPRRAPLERPAARGAAPKVHAACLPHRPRREGPGPVTVTLATTAHAPHGEAVVRGDPG